MSLQTLAPWRLVRFVPSDTIARRSLDMLRVGLPLPLALVLTACTVAMPAPQVDVPTPAVWNAPHDAVVSTRHTNSAAQLKSWWQQWDDPLLMQLLERAQQASPSVAAAASTRNSRARAMRAR